MEFDPRNPVIQYCVQGMEMEDTGNRELAYKLFQQAWAEAKNDFEKFTAAYFIARQHHGFQDKLDWYEIGLKHALKVESDTVKSSLSGLYSNMAKCYEGLEDLGSAKKYNALARELKDTIFDQGPFYHGTKADLKPGDLLTPGGESNYTSGLNMNHIYFTSLVDGAGLAAALAKGEGMEHVYQVTPIGTFENDPNVTDKKFPGNPSRSYRSRAPLKIIDEVSDWRRLTPEELQHWRKKLAKSDGKIIN